MKWIRQSTTMLYFKVNTQCKKEVVRTVFSKLKLNVRSTKGSNLKEISILVDKRVEDLSPKEAYDVHYHQVFLTSEHATCVVLQ